MLADGVLCKEYETDWIEGFLRTRTGYVLDTSGIKMYRQEFLSYAEQGILSGSFDDTVWVLHDVLKDVRLAFSQDEVGYKRGAGTWIGLTFPLFCQTQHAYLMKKVGTRVSDTLQKVTKTLVELGNMSLEDVLAHPFEPVWLEYLSLLPGVFPGRTRVIAAMEEMEEDYKPPKSKQRELAPMREYLSFDEKLKAYFLAEASCEARLKYYPVRLWWDIGTVLPIRVTEFLLTPKDCLRENDGMYFLTIRRSTKKKGGRLIHYDLENDYKCYEYQIPERVAEEILEYQDLASSHRPEGNWSLFLPIGGNKGYLEYMELSLLLKEFCEEVASMGRTSIRLGDTRHLAMINIALSGASPEVCMELAGQEDIDIASHYYSNLSSLVDSAIMFRMEDGEAKVTGHTSLPADPVSMFRVDGGWCDNHAVPAGDVGECLKNYGQVGHLGDCTGCVHYHPNDPGIQVILKEERTARLDLDWNGLLEAVDLFAKDKGCQEGVLAAMAKLKNSAYKYAALKVQKKEEDGNGKKEEERFFHTGLSDR